MPELTLISSDPSDNAIVADAARNSIIVSSNASFRWSFGTTYVAADSQLAIPSEPLIIDGVLAQNAISFGPSTNCKLNITLA